MYSISDKDVINKAYEYLEKVTPLYTDCGKLCSYKCCTGKSNDGMLLFPGEEKYFENRAGFTVYFDEKYENYCVRCNGDCDRHSRPLSCRIFPYFVYVKQPATKPVCAPDLRAVEFCPLIDDKIKLDKKFLRMLRITARLLCTDKECEEFLLHISSLLTDFNDL